RRAEAVAHPLPRAVVRRARGNGDLPPQRPRGRPDRRRRLARRGDGGHGQVSSLYDEIQEVRARYSEGSPSAALPALRLPPEEHEVLLAGADERDLTQLTEYQAIGGYRGVDRARAMTPDALIAELEKAVLRGRGGAGFPMGRKASLIDRKSPKPKYLVVNADESEPGAFKDREVMARVPHRLIEGCLIAAHAIESTDVFIYIRGEYLTEYEIL